MANVATVFVRIVRGRAMSASPSHTRMLSALMHSYGGRTYCVPIWAAQRDGCFDLQYGAKWSPGTGPERLWRRLNGSAEAIWIRWHDSGGDFDRVFSIDAVGTTEPRECRYRFDSIALDGNEQLAVKGSYLAGNPRGMTGDERSGGETTGLDPEITALLAARRKERVDYFFRGRRVRSEIKGACFSYDDWDNCADEDFLAVR